MTRNGSSVRLYHWTFFVHLWTLFGVALGMLAIKALFEGDFDGAARLVICVLIVDLTDGTLARGLRVKQRMPLISGDVIDYIHDLVGLTLAPMLLLWRAEVFLPGWGFPLAVGATMAATLKYGMKGGILDLGYSIGAPPIFVALLLCWLLGVDQAAATVAAVLLLVLVLAPVRFPISSLVTTHWKPGWQSVTNYLFALSVVPILIWLRDAPAVLYWALAGNVLLQCTVVPLLLRLGVIRAGFRRVY